MDRFNGHKSDMRNHNDTTVARHMASHNANPENPPPSLSVYCTTLVHPVLALRPQNWEIDGNACGWPDFAHTSQKGSTFRTNGFLGGPPHRTFRARPPANARLVPLAFCSGTLPLSHPYSLFPWPPPGPVPPPPGSRPPRDSAALANITLQSDRVDHLGLMKTSDGRNHCLESHPDFMSQCTHA